jgi:hypothetical protein
VLRKVHASLNLDAEGDPQGSLNMCLDTSCIIKAEIVPHVFDEQQKQALKVYLHDTNSHGKWFPPMKILQQQIDYLSKFSLLVTVSESKNLCKNTGVTKDVGALITIGEGLFCGNNFLPATTQLIYTGLIYHGPYDPDAMAELWCDVNGSPIEEHWWNKIMEVIPNELYIIGHPRSLISKMNTQKSVFLNQCFVVSIDQIGLITFDKEVAPYHEIFLNYNRSIPMNMNQFVRQPRTRKSEVVSLITGSNNAISFAKVSSNNAKRIKSAHPNFGGVYSGAVQSTKPPSRKKKEEKKISPKFRLNLIVLLFINTLEESTVLKLVSITR